MHAETKAELLTLKSETQALRSETQAQKSETQALKTEMRQMEASMGSKIASIEKALMHGKNKTWSDNDRALFWMGGHSCQFCIVLHCVDVTLKSN